MISHQHKYIFVHIPKCGGTSVEKSLLMAENVDLNLRRGGGNPTTRGFELTRLSKKYQVEYKVGIDGRQHLFLDKFPPRCQKDYFCFTFVRNPWDLLVSKYYYSRQPQKGVSFREMIFLMDDAKMKPRHRLKWNQTDFINSNIDYVGRFENLEADFEKICATLNLDPPKLEHLNTTKHAPYWEYYDEETRDMVATRYQKDIETFGYKFGNTLPDKPLSGFPARTSRYRESKDVSDNLASKRIWIYWAQGWDKAPEICKICRDSWVKANPSWEVVQLDQDSIQEFIPSDIYAKILKFGGKWTHMIRSELIRFYLLATYGGVWTDATNVCNHPLDDWLVESRLVDDIWLHCDFDSACPTYNFLYSRTTNNEIFLKSFNSIIDNSSLHEGPYHRGGWAFRRSLDPKLVKKLRTKKQIGKSSNNTKPKQGVKIIANRVKLMTRMVDSTFMEAIKIYPFFKLGWKFDRNGTDLGRNGFDYNCEPLQSIFPPDSKLIYLLRSLSLLTKSE